jgi:ATP-dependent DNA helicase RecQ
LSRREKVTLTRPVAVPEAKGRRSGEIACDEVLFDRLRGLRKRLADDRSVPAYIIFSDVALRLMARDYPANEREFARISGVGEKKLQEFGATFLEEIAIHLQNNPRQVFADDFSSPPAASKASLTDTVVHTLQLFRSGKTIAEIARHRKLVETTIYGHLTTAIESGESLEWRKIITEAQRAKIEAAFARTGPGNLSGAKELLGDAFQYDQLRIVRALMNAGC